jgi:hypothetical protein
VFDATGELYGTTWQGGSGCWMGCDVVFELIPNSDGSWTEDTIYSFSGRDGYGPIDRLIFDSAGKLYGTTAFGGRAGCFNELVDCRRVTITILLASKLSWPVAANSCLLHNSIPT